VTTLVGNDGIDGLSGHECPHCGSEALRPELVKSAFFQGDRLVVVEGIPALVCSSCGERFYDDATATALDLLHGAGFPGECAVTHVQVPVFSFSHRVPRELVSAALEQT